MHDLRLVSPAERVSESGSRDAVSKSIDRILEFQEALKNPARWPFGLELSGPRYAKVFSVRTFTEIETVQKSSAGAELRNLDTNPGRGRQCCVRRSARCVSARTRFCELHQRVQRHRWAEIGSVPGEYTAG